MDKKKITKKQKIGMLILVIAAAALCLVISYVLENRAAKIREDKAEVTMTNTTKTSADIITMTAEAENTESAKHVEEASKIRVTRAYIETEETQALPEINMSASGLDEKISKDVRDCIKDIINGYGYQNAEKINFMEKEETEEEYTLYFEIRLKDEESRIVEITYDKAAGSCEAVMW